MCGNNYETCVLYVTYISHKLPLFLLHVYFNGLILVMLTNNMILVYRRTQDVIRKSMEVVDGPKSPLEEFQV